MVFSLQVVNMILSIFLVQSFQKLQILMILFQQPLIVLTLTQQFKILLQEQQIQRHIKTTSNKSHVIYICPYNTIDMQCAMVVSWHAFECVHVRVA